MPRPRFLCKSRVFWIGCAAQKGTLLSTKSKPKVEDPFFDVAGCAEYLNQTERWVRRQVNEGRIRYTRMGNLLRFRKSWLDEYVEEHTVTPEDGS